MIEEKDLPFELKENIVIKLDVNEFSVYKDDDWDDYGQFFSDGVISLSSLKKDMLIDGDKDSDVESAYIIQIHTEDKDDTYSYVMYYTHDYLKSNTKVEATAEQVKETRRQATIELIEEEIKNLKSETNTRISKIKKLITNLKI